MGPPESSLGSTSATISVPAAVPLDFQSSRPLVPSSAVKNSVLPTAVSWLGFEEPPADGSMSSTSAVPAAVPSDFHSSEPCVPSSATKYRVLPMGVRSFSPSLPDGSMVSTRTVPAAVPSDFQSWVAPASSTYSKNSVPLTSAPSSAALGLAARSAREPCRSAGSGSSAARAGPTPAMLSARAAAAPVAGRMAARRARRRRAFSAARRRCALPCSSRFPLALTGEL